MSTHTQGTDGKFRKFWVKSVNNYITDADYNGKALKDRNPIPSFREFHFIKSEDDLKYFSKREGISNIEIVYHLLKSNWPLNATHPDTEHDTAQSDQDKSELKVGMRVTHKHVIQELVITADEKGPAYTGNEFADNEISLSHAIMEYKNGNLSILEPSLPSIYTALKLKPEKPC